MGSQESWGTLTFQQSWREDRRALSGLLHDSPSDVPPPLVPDNDLARATDAEFGSDNNDPEESRNVLAFVDHHHRYQRQKRIHHLKLTWRYLLFARAKLLNL
jgi:hypothetical protein